MMIVNQHYPNIKYPMMDSWNADLVLQVIQFLSLKDGNRLAAASQRYYFLVHQYRKVRGPEIVAVSSKVPGVKLLENSTKECINEAIERLQKPPNIVFVFSKERLAVEENIMAQLPDDCVVLGAKSEAIQTCIQEDIDCKSDFAVMMGNMDATIKPFFFAESFDFNTLIRELAEMPQDHWKAFMLYASGPQASMVDDIVHALQTAYPQSIIVGGISSEVFVTTPVKQLPEKELMRLSILNLIKLNKAMGGPPLTDTTKEAIVKHIQKVMLRRQFKMNTLDDGGIVGIALGGEVPIRSTVSRGVRSLTLRSSPQPSTNLYVEHSLHHRPSDQAFMFRGEDIPSYHLIRRVVDRDTLTIYTPDELVAMYGKPDLVGIRRPNQDGFELHVPHPIASHSGGFLFFEDTGTDLGGSLEGCNIDLFALEGRACLEDMEVTMEQLRQQTQGQNILGAIMVSCTARGPHKGALIYEEMADATRFSTAFPKVPCLGFYAGGEIGPVALAGRRDVFRSGKATLQGFTAVFAIFMAPIVDFSSIHWEDSAENVQQFIQSYLHGRMK